MRLLDRFKKVDSLDKLPKKSLFIILTRSNKGFLGKTIQGFMRLWQWRRGERDTDHIPNHADGLRNGYGIGALAFGVDGNDIKSHFNKNAEFFIIEPILTKTEKDRFWKFMKDQQKEKYAYLDLLKYAIMTVTNKWFGKPEKLDRNKWTCFSLIASAYNYAVKDEVFEDPYNITPYEVCVVIDKYYGVKFK